MPFFQTNTRLNIQKIVLIMGISFFFHSLTLQDVSWKLLAMLSSRVVHDSNSAVHCVQIRVQTLSSSKWSECRFSCWEVMPRIRTKMLWKWKFSIGRRRRMKCGMRGQKLTYSWMTKNRLSSVRKSRERWIFYTVWRTNCRLWMVIFAFCFLLEITWFDLHSLPGNFWEAKISPQSRHPFCIILW